MNLRVTMKNSFLNVDEPSAGGLDDLAMPELIRGQTAPDVFPSARHAIDSQPPGHKAAVPLIGLSWPPFVHSVLEESRHVNDNLVVGAHSTRSDHGSSDSQDWASTISAVLGLESTTDSDVTSILSAAPAGDSGQDAGSLRSQNQLLTNALFAIAESNEMHQQRNGSGGGSHAYGNFAASIENGSCVSSPYFIGAASSPSGLLSTPDYGRDQMGGSMGGPAGQREEVCPLEEEEGDDDVNNTTVMLRNIPNRFDTQSLIEQIYLMGFENTFDFLYLPIDIRNKCNVGYAFLNFRQHSRALDFKRTFTNYRLPALNSHKICRVCWALVQGFNKNVEHYRNSPIPEKHRPLIADAQGRWIPFPKPDPHVEELIRSRMAQEEMSKALGSRKIRSSTSYWVEDSHKIFIGGLGRYTTSSTLRAHFSKFGAVREAPVVMDRTSGKSRRFGFCVFEHEVPKAVFELPHEIDGVLVAVEYYSSNT
ncbi:dc50, putative [Perkinsus marinus ATCC 50983]|uniref:Dc50, putative n=1 Tax=Perkinsus marinus (strain ATCC 50983 / TXsc) TaxID=423536 RepID=C5KQP8_PERM5|nr:dc50, putative [Perkinsus marinus ATCC 50983]EER13144.1 dc50, putative [Perkinsus marinus ATCC 50983]|eukprot:XP_002781349.1 dc50, putative [Perkinsus marinus ATCC 50983]